MNLSQSMFFLFLFSFDRDPELQDLVIQSCSAMKGFKKKGEMAIE